MSSSQSNEQAEWKRLLDRKRTQLKGGNSNSFKTVEFDDFKQYLQTLNAKYSRTTTASFLTRYNSSLEHVLSFDKAISSAAQPNAASAIIWGGSLAIIKVSQPLFGETHPEGLTLPRPQTITQSRSKASSTSSVN
jgi:hypothetical protein